MNKINYRFYNKITGESIQTGQGNESRYNTLVDVLESGKMPKTNHNKSFVLLLSRKLYGVENIKHYMMHTGDQDKSLERERQMKEIYGGGTCKELSIKLLNDLIEIYKEHYGKLNPFTIHILSNWSKHGDSFSHSRFNVDTLPIVIRQELELLLGDIF